MNALGLFRAGKLGAALEASAADTQLKPADPSPRDLLAQLLCFRGQFPRADKHLETLALQFPDRAPAIALIRQLIRAAEAREQFYRDGRFPEPLVELTPLVRQHLEASVFMRAGDLSGAYQLLVETESQRPRLAGTCNGTEFADFRDVTDLLAPVFEVLTPTGKYAWVPMERVTEITFPPVESPLDVLWRRARMVVRDGPDGDVYMPSLYYGSHAVEDEELQVGRAADWVEVEHEPLRGIGQKVMSVDGSDVPLITINELRFNAHAD
jgi:type VI secretion system protein ImpE